MLDSPSLPAIRERATLRPCPFCAGQPHLESEPYNSMSGINPPETRSWVVRCVSCAAQGPWYKCEGNAVRGWNTRRKKP